MGVNDHLFRLGVKNWPGTHWIAGNAITVRRVPKLQGTEVSHLLLEFALLNVCFFAVEVRRFYFGTGKPCLVEVVLGFEVGILQSKALFQPSTIRVGLDPHRRYTEVKERVPNGQAIREGEVELPTLLTNIADSECPNLHTADRNFLGSGEREGIIGNAIGVIHELGERGPRIGSPKTQCCEVFAAVMERDVRETFPVAHVTHPDVVAVTGVSAADDAEAVLCQSDDGEVGANTPLMIKEVGVNTFPNSGIGAHLCYRQILHECFGIRAFNIEDGKVRQIDHANAVAHGELLGV